MIKSMTGFGRAEVSGESCKVTVEMKSVNHRYLDVNMKMPKKLKSPKTLRFRGFLARWKEFESPTFRLGGGRSILLSYKRIYDTIQTDYHLPFCKGEC